MSETLRDRCRNMVLGALVADAAAMGLHWIYDQTHIRKIAPHTPEFREPDARNYEGVMAFFAHPNRAAGAQSQYGEQTVVMLKTLAASGGQYETAAFAEAFRAHFGYGGSYVGYIDHATRETLDNFRRYQDAAAACIATLPFDGPNRIAKDILAKALPLLARHTGAELYKVFEATVLSDHSDQATGTYAMQLLEALKSLPLPNGADDIQLPAIAKLPPLVAMLTLHQRDIDFDEIIASSVQVTNHNPIADHYGKISARMMKSAIMEGTISATVAAVRATAEGEAADLLDQAFALANESNESVTQRFGMACDLPFGVPSAIHNIATATSYHDAIRRNIYAGGDTCGRAILVGAVMGAVYGIGGEQGIPPDWIDRLEMSSEVDRLGHALFP